MKNKVLIGIVSFVVMSVCVYLFIDGINKERTIEEEIEQALVDYENYLEFKDVYDADYPTVIIESDNFLNEVAYSNDEVASSVRDYVEDKINETLSDYLSFAEFYSYQLKTLEGLVENVDYITYSNKEEFHRKLKAYEEFESITASHTSEEAKQIAEDSRVEIKIGHTEQEVVERIGKPKRTSTANTANETLKMWYYSDKVIYIKNGIVYKTVEA